MKKRTHYISEPTIEIMEKKISAFIDGGHKISGSTFINKVGNY